jgi:hypothetical protein
VNDSPEQRGETLPPAENGGKPLHHEGQAMPLPGSNWTEDDAQYLIAELRVLIWKFGPRNMVLEDAESVAQHCWTSIRDGKPWI